MSSPSAAPVTYDPRATENRTIADGEPHTLDPRSIELNRISWWCAVVLAGVALLIVGLGLVLEDRLASAGIIAVGAGGATVLALMIGLALRHPQWAYDRTRYLVSPDGIEIRRGILFRKIITVPRSRVQHTDVAQGPLLRLFGLARLVIHTAGTEHASVTLSGVSHERALEIRDFLIGGQHGDAV